MLFMYQDRRLMQLRRGIIIRRSGFAGRYAAFWEKVWMNYSGRKMKKTKNNLDEMQEKSLLHVEKNCFWGLYWLLFASMFLQLLFTGGGSGHSASDCELLCGSLWILRRRSGKVTEAKIFTIEFAHYWNGAKSNV